MVVFMVISVVSFALLFFYVLLPGGGSPGSLNPSDKLAAVLLLAGLTSFVSSFLSFNFAFACVLGLVVAVVWMLLALHWRAVGVWTGRWKRQPEEKRFFGIRFIYDWYRRGWDQGLAARPLAE